MSQTRQIISHLGSWPNWAKFSGITAAGLLLALGRYDWLAHPGYAVRAWVLSGYFFLLLLAGATLAAQALGLAGRGRFWPLLTSAALVLNLPYRWLGLGSWFYLENHAGGYGFEKTFAPEWLLHGNPRIPWNGTDALLLGLLGLAALGWWLARRGTLARRDADLLWGLSGRGFFCLLLGFMTAEMWLHLSNRSPYTYISHYEQPEANHYVYAYNLLPDGRGAVNADAGYFLELEDLFQGHGAGPHMLLVRRPFSFYLSSHLSYFIGGYHAFLILNLLFWFAAAAAMFHFARDLTGSAAVAVSAAGFVACGPGFIMYAAQPMAYLPGFAILALAVFLYHRLLQADRFASVATVTAAGILIGITFLTYDNFAWALFFLGYPLLMRASVLRAGASVLIGAAIYVGYLLLVFHIFSLPPADHQNDQYMGEAARHTLDLLRHPASAKIRVMLGSYFGNYWSQVLQVNFYVPALLAVLGFCFTRSGFLIRAIALLLFLPSAAAFGVLYFGESFLASYSRFNYASYPAVVLLAALAIGRTAEYFAHRHHPRSAACLLALPFLACAVLANIDAFGLMQRLYFHFYFSTGGTFS